MLKPNFLLTHKIPINILRSTAGSYVEGVWVDGAETVVETFVNIQPLKPYEILQMPEAERTRSWFKLYSAEPLRTLKEGTSGWAADEFVWKDDRYKIMKVDDWSNAMGILEHYRAFAVKIGPTPN